MIGSAATKVVPGVDAAASVIALLTLPDVLYEPVVENSFGEKGPITCILGLTAN